MFWSVARMQVVQPPVMFMSTPAVQARSASEVAFGCSLPQAIISRSYVNGNV
jgi:hypothetical protein